MPLTAEPPIAHVRAPEVALARAGALGAAVVAVAVAVVGTALSGAPVALVAGGGALLVAVLSLAAMPLHKLGALAGNDMVVAMSLAALGLRLVLALAVFALLRFATDVDMTPFAIGLAAGLVGAIAAEMATAARDPRLFFVQTTPSWNPTSGETERQLT